jgi:hypothetical protein
MTAGRGDDLSRPRNSSGYTRNAMRTDSERKLIRKR